MSRAHQPPLHVGHLSSCSCSTCRASDTVQYRLLFMPVSSHGSRCVAVRSRNNVQFSKVFLGKILSQHSASLSVAVRLGVSMDGFAKSHHPQCHLGMYDRLDGGSSWTISLRAWHAAAAGSQTAGNPFKSTLSAIRSHRKHAMNA